MLTEPQEYLAQHATRSLVCNPVDSRAVAVIVDSGLSIIHQPPVPTFDFLDKSNRGERKSDTRYP